MRILIQFPTRNRPERFFEYLNRYIDYANDKANLIVHVSMDVDDASMNNPEMIEKLEALKCSYTFATNKTKHEAVNRGISLQIDQNDVKVILLASDDMLPIVQGYDDIIREDMKKVFHDLDGALWYYDGNRKDINTLQIMGVPYYQRFGYIYRQETIAFYGDTEFQAVAEKLGKLHYIDKCIIKHEHYEWNPTIAKDESYDRNSRFFQHDAEVFSKRATEGFPLERTW